MTEKKLFMVLLGCKPQGRNTEQHDIFFGIGDSLRDMVPQIEAFWKDAGKIHIDCWREVTTVDGYSITIKSRTTPIPPSSSTDEKLFFINLGGYKENDFEEYHYKMLRIAREKGKAIQDAMQTAFYKHMSFKGAESHIDDKYGVDVDDIYEIQDILSPELKEQYKICVEKGTGNIMEDELHPGYTKISDLVTR
ncbi:MAG TPA: DUF1543 domain-containing protein [Chitinophagaceae bacterium]|nr:DUF1543 domain-containing protein [Chitinophagaceae bacterium]